MVSTDLKSWVKLAEGLATVEIVDFIDHEAQLNHLRYYKVMAGEFSSSNVVGYVTVTLPCGQSMISNPFINEDNSVQKVLSKVPEGVALSKFDPAESKLGENLFKNGRWSNPKEQLTPGEGGLFLNSSGNPVVVDFSGEIPQGNLSSTIPAGFSIQSYKLPLAGRLADLQFPGDNGDEIHVFDRATQQYVYYTIPSREWQTKPPFIAVCESFWVEKKSSRVWIQEYYSK